MTIENLHYLLVGAMIGFAIGAFCMAALTSRGK